MLRTELTIYFSFFQKVKTFTQHLKFNTRHKFINIFSTFLFPDCDFPYFSCIPSNPVTNLWYKPVHVYALAETQVVGTGGTNALLKGLSGPLYV